MKTFRLIGAILVGVSISMVGKAQTFSTSGSYNTGTNWALGSVPVNDPNSTIQLNASPTFSGASNTAGDVTAANNVTIQIDAGASYTLGDPSLFSANTKKSLTFSNNGTLQINSGSPDGKLEIWGDLIVNNNLQVQITGILIVHGNIVMNNNAQIQVSGGGAITVGGNVSGGNNAQIQVSGTGSSISVGGSLSLGNGGTIQTSGGGSVSAGSCSCSGCSGQCSVVTPVTLLNFYSSLGYENVILHWSTASELNFNYFDLQRSNDGSNFNSIGEIMGHGTTNVRHDYSFEDNFPLIGKNYYRLTSVDFDNYRETFKVIVQEYAGDKDFQISPNPSDGKTINLHLNFDSKEGQVIIYDNIGSAVEAFQVTETGEVTFVNTLKNGIYFAKYSSPSFTKAIRFLVRQ